MPTRFGIATMGSKPSHAFLINEDCEATGAPAAWNTASGVPDWDYTAAPLAGAQSLYLPSASSNNRVRVNFTNQTEVWVYFLFRLVNGAPPGAGVTVGGLGANGDAAPSQNFQYAANLKPSFATASPTAAFVADTTYHVWLHYRQGTGADAVSDIGFSTTGVRPTSGSTYAQILNGTGTNLLGRFYAGPSAAGGSGYDLIWDNMRVTADSQIGDNGL